MQNLLMRLKAVGTDGKVGSKKLARCTRRRIRGSGGGAIIEWTDIPVLIVAGVRLDAISQK
jgi:hypothetical protein